MSSADTQTFSVAMARFLKAFSDVVETVAEALRECIAKDGSELAGPTEGTCCYCTHDGKHFITGDNDHCDYWEAL